MKRLVFSVLAILLLNGAICMAAIGFDDVNKDVHNNSSQSAYGFRIVLRGKQNVTWHFDGYPNKRHFGHFESNFMLDTGGEETTVLQWDEPLPEPIPYCEWVHVGYRLDTHADVLQACWTDESGQCIPDGFIPQPSQTVDQENGTITLTIKNALQNPELTVSVYVLGYLIWDGTMGLDALNRANPSLAPSNFTPFPGTTGEIILEHGELVSFTIPMSLGVGRSFIYCKGDGKDPEDPDATFWDFGQYYPGEVPTVSQWGLIVMAALLLTAGTIVIIRQRKQIAA